MKYKGVVFLGQPSDPDDIRLAKAYVKAAFSLDEGFSASIDIEHAKNNLWYLKREYEETGCLFRVFVPFKGDDINVSEAKEIALMRGLLEHEGEPDYEVTPEVEVLLGWEGVPLTGTCFGSDIFFRGDKLLERYPETSSYILGPEGSPSKTETVLVATVPPDKQFTWEQVDRACRKIWDEVGHALCGHPHCMIGAYLDVLGITHNYGCTN